MQPTLSFDFQPAAGRRRDATEAFRLLLLGDFSGRPGHARTPLAQRPAMRVDVDNLDAVLQHIGPVWGDLAFGAIDDFHPDALFARLPMFAAWRQTRERLCNPATFAQAAADLGAAVAATPDRSGGDLLAGLLGGRPAAAAPPATGLDALIRQAVAPHVVPNIQPQQQALLAAVDATLATLMRGLLHDPAFQALEAAWRGVRWLVNGLELDESLQLHLLDVTQAELLDDVVAAGGRIEQTGLRRALSAGHGAPDGARWAALVGLYGFGAADADTGLLAALGLVAAGAGAPLLATADPTLATGDAAAPAGWPVLRRSQAAPWIGLVAQRLLLRLPYGKACDPIDAFAFEEVVGAPRHEDLLWGHGSLVPALLIGRAFAARGWSFEPGDEREVDGLPAYTFVRDGERELHANAERHVDEEAGLALLQAGLMPLFSHRQRAAVTLPRMQSIADPPRALAGFGAR